MNSPSPASSERYQQRKQNRSRKPELSFPFGINCYRTNQLLSPRQECRLGRIRSTRKNRRELWKFNLTEIGAGGRRPNGSTAARILQNGCVDHPIPDSGCNMSRLPITPPIKANTPQISITSPDPFQKYAQPLAFTCNS